MSTGFWAKPAPDGSLVHATQVPKFGSLPGPITDRGITGSQPEQEAHSPHPALAQHSHRGLTVELEFFVFRLREGVASPTLGPLTTDIEAQMAAPPLPAL